MKLPKLALLLILLTGMMTWRAAAPLSAQQIINDIAASPAGTGVAIADSSGVWVYEIATLKPTMLLPEPAMSLAWSPDGTSLIIGTMDSRVLTWELTTGALEERVGHSGIVRDVDWSPDGRFLVSVADDGSRLWDKQVRGASLLLQDHAPYAHEGTFVRFSPDSQSVATGTQNGDVLVWSAVAGELKDAYSQFIFKPGPAEGVWTSDGSRFAVLMPPEPDATQLSLIVYLLSANSQPDVELLNILVDLNTHHIAFNRAGTRLAMIVGNQVRLLDTSTWKDASVYEAGVAVQTLSWSPGGKQFWIAAGAEVLAIDAAGGQAVATVNHSAITGGVTIAESEFTLPDGTIGTVANWQSEAAASPTEAVASAVEVFTPGWAEGFPVINSANAGQLSLQYSLKGTGWPLGAPQFSPDGTMLAAPGGQATILWFLFEPIDLLDPLALPGAEQVVFNRDGSMVAVYTRIWDPQTRTQRLELETASLASSSDIAFSVDSRWLAMGQKPLSGRPRVAIYNTETGEEARQLDIPAEATRVRFSPDGRWLATGHDNGVIILWDTASWERTLSFETLPDERILDMEFTPDSAFIAATTFSAFHLDAWSIPDGVEVEFAANDLEAEWLIVSGTSHQVITSHFRRVDAYNLDTGERTFHQDYGNTGTAVESLAVSPDGSLVYFSHGLDTEVFQVWDLATNSRPGIFAGEAYRMISSTGIAAHPSGRFVAFKTGNDTINLYAVGD